jgi:hypothetical protein
MDSQNVNKIDEVVFNFNTLKTFPDTFRHVTVCEILIYKSHI